MTNEYATLRAALALLRGQPTTNSEEIGSKSVDWQSEAMQKEPQP